MVFNVSVIHGFNGSVIGTFNLKNAAVNTTSVESFLREKIVAKVAVPLVFLRIFVRRSCRNGKTESSTSQNIQDNIDVESQSRQQQPIGDHHPNTVQTQDDSPTPQSDATSNGLVKVSSKFSIVSNISLNSLGNSTNSNLLDSDSGQCNNFQELGNFEKDIDDDYEWHEICDLDISIKKVYEQIRNKKTITASSALVNRCEQANNDQICVENSEKSSDSSWEMVQNESHKIDTYLTTETSSDNSKDSDSLDSDVNQNESNKKVTQSQQYELVLNLLTDDRPFRSGPLNPDEWNPRLCRSSRTVFASPGSVGSPTALIHNNNNGSARLSQNENDNHTDDNHSSVDKSTSQSTSTSVEDQHARFKNFSATKIILNPPNLSESQSTDISTDINNAQIESESLDLQRGAKTVADDQEFDITSDDINSLDSDLIALAGLHLSELDNHTKSDSDDHDRSFQDINESKSNSSSSTSTSLLSFFKMRPWVSGSTTADSGIESKTQASESKIQQQQVTGPQLDQKIQKLNYFQESTNSKSNPINTTTQNDTEVLKRQNLQPSKNHGVAYLLLRSCFGVVRAEEHAIAHLVEHANARVQGYSHPSNLHDIQAYSEEECAKIIDNSKQSEISSTSTLSTTSHGSNFACLRNQSELANHHISSTGDGTNSNYSRQCQLCKTKDNHNDPDVTVTTTVTEQNPLIALYLSTWFESTKGGGHGPLYYAMIYRCDDVFRRFWTSKDCADMRVRWLTALRERQR